MTKAEIKKAQDQFKSWSHEDQVEFSKGILPGLETNDQQAVDSWRPLTMSDVFEPMPPVEFIASGILERESLNILYGPPGTLKSFLLQDLAVCVATGSNWIEPAPWGEGGRLIRTTQAPTLWLDFDMGQRRTRERFAALARHHKATKETPLTIYTMPRPGLDAGDPVHVDLLAQRALGIEAGFIVIDNLRTISGGRDENDSRMSDVTDNLRWLAELTKAAVVVIHHERKSGGFKARMGDSLRGHSSIEAAIDLALKVEREPQANLITITSTKTRGLEVLPFSAVFSHTKDGGGTLETACFFSVESEDTQSDFAIDREIKTALKDNPMNQTSTTEAVKQVLPDVGVNRIRDRLQQLSAADKVRVTKGKNFSKIYSLPVSVDQRLPGVDNE